MITKGTLHLDLVNLVTIAEGFLSGHPALTEQQARSASIPLLKVAEREIPNLETAPRRLSDPAEALTKAREVAKQGREARKEEFRKLTRRWTRADYYFVIREAIAYYGFNE